MKVETDLHTFFFTRKMGPKMLSPLLSCFPLQADWQAVTVRMNYVVQKQHKIESKKAKGCGKVRSTSTGKRHREAARLSGCWFAASSLKRIQK